MKNSRQISYFLRLQWGPENLQSWKCEQWFAQWAAYWNILHQSLPWETLANPELWKTLSPRSNLITRGFMGSLTNAVNVSILTSLTLSHSERVHARGQLFKILSVHSVSDSMHISLGFRKPTLGRNPSKHVGKKLPKQLQLPYPPTKSYWWKFVYLSGMWQRHGDPS